MKKYFWKDTASILVGYTKALRSSSTNVWQQIHARLKRERLKVRGRLIWRNLSHFFHGLLARTHVGEKREIGMPDSSHSSCQGRTWPCLGNRRWMEHGEDANLPASPPYERNRKPNSHLLSPRSTVQARTHVTGSSCEALQILPPHSCCIAAEISTDHYFTAQQQKGNLFMGSRSRWKMKQSWHAFSQREIGLWAGRRRVRKQGIARKTRSGTDANQWFFFFFF